MFPFPFIFFRAKRASNLVSLVQNVDFLSVFLILHKFQIYFTQPKLNIRLSNIKSFRSICLFLRAPFPPSLRCPVVFPKHVDSRLDGIQTHITNVSRIGTLRNLLPQENNFVARTINRFLFVQFFAFKVIPKCLYVHPNSLAV